MICTECNWKRTMRSAGIFDIYLGFFLIKGSTLDSPGKRRLNGKIELTERWHSLADLSAWCYMIPSVRLSISPPTFWLSEYTSQALCLPWSRVERAPPELRREKQTNEGRPLRSECGCWAESSADSDPVGKELEWDLAVTGSSPGLKMGPVMFDVMSFLTKPCSSHQEVPVPFLSCCSENTGDIMAVGP